MLRHATYPPEVREPRFRFGRNWSRFLEKIDQRTIQRAELSLQQALRIDDLQRQSFLDLGSGSGLFSLAAWRLGAQVHSIDLDPESVACASELHRRYAGGHGRWTVQQGSVLDQALLERLGSFDIVYSWGVLHHTGEMWQALDNAVDRVTSRGKLYIAIYNDQGRTSRRWARIKRLYNRLPRGLRFLVLGPALLRIWGPATIRDALHFRPFHTWRTYESDRGMSAWRDFIDWVGGYPFEVARPEEVIDFCNARGLQLTHSKTCGSGRGCNEFVFEKEETSSS